MTVAVVAAYQAEPFGFGFDPFNLFLSNRKKGGITNTKRTIEKRRTITAMLTQAQHDKEGVAKRDSNHTEDHRKAGMAFRKLRFSTAVKKNPHATRYLGKKNRTTDCDRKRPW